MDNTLTLNEVEKTIHLAIAEADADFANNVMHGTYVNYVYKALKDKGFLKDEY